MSSGQLRPPPVPKTAKNLPKNKLTIPATKPQPASGVKPTVKNPATKKTTANSAPKPTTSPVVAVPEPLAPPAWVEYIGPAWGGIKATIQAFICAFTLLTLLILVVLLADGEGTTWALTITGATRFWLLGHGAPTDFGELHLSLTPLGFTLLCVMLVRARAKRTPASLSAVISGSLAYASITFAITRIAGSPPTVTSRASLAALVIGIIGFLWGVAPRLDWTRKLLVRCPVSVYAGLKAAGIALLTAIGVAAILAGVWALLGRENSRSVAETLQPGLIGSVVVGISQLFLLPNWLIWISGWLAGPGFSLGTGSQFSPATWQGGPLPALPIVASLPPASWSGPYWQWVPVIGLLIGALAGEFLWRFLGGRLLGVGTLWGAVATAIGGTTAAMFGLQWMAQGSLGSGRLSAVGATPWLVAVIFGGEVAAGIVMVIIGKLIGKRPTSSNATNSSKATRAKVAKADSQATPNVSMPPQSIPVRKSVFTLLDDD